MPYFAHSARPALGIPAQDYCEHVLAVRRLAREKANAALHYHDGERSWFVAALDWTACFHDLGKLHDSNQAVLAGGNGSASLPLNHVDAGVAHLIRCLNDELTAGTAYGHHIGLVNREDERKKQHAGGQAFRDEAIRVLVDSELDELVRRHRSIAGPDPRPLEKKAGASGLERRLLLSCLVDADHSDTAKHYGEERTVDSPAARWTERLAALDAHVAGLGRAGGARCEYRSDLYQACRSASSEDAFVACDSPVGSGKTTAVMAYLLQAAIDRGLRRIFVVLPYTNIIRQAVRTYRAAICLPGEDAEAVVAAHYHLTEFEEPSARHLTTLWRAPIVVTTAVQFFETLGCAGTGRLRKLHELPGSGIFIDEAHASMPVHLWPYMWRHMEELASDWGCRFVLGSGSLAKFWENRRFIKWVGHETFVRRLSPANLAWRGDEGERERVVYRHREGVLNLSELSTWILSTKGPRVAVMNTVHSAAALARRLRDEGQDVVHLSTALAPSDREGVIRRIEEKLRWERDGSWTLVATSCVEAGLDFDFATGFRERASAASLIQLGGRVNRHGERGQAVVWDFTAEDKSLREHPGFKAGRRVVAKMFARRFWDQENATSLMTTAFDWELIESGEDEKLPTLLEAERAGSFRTVAELSRLIQADTRLVVVDPGLIELIRRRDRFCFRRLLAGSVQLWSTRVSGLRLEAVPGMRNLYFWNYEYEPDFLGIMAGVLRLSAGDEDGYLIV